MLTSTHNFVIVIICLLLYIIRPCQVWCVCVCARVCLCMHMCCVVRVCVCVCVCVFVLSSAAIRLEGNTFPRSVF